MLANAMPQAFAAPAPTAIGAITAVDLSAAGLGAAFQHHGAPPSMANCTLATPRNAVGPVPMRRCRTAAAAPVARHLQGSVTASGQDTDFMANVRQAVFTALAR